MSVDYVIQHAAPTLAGIKTGNLFPCFFSSPQAMVRDLRAINQVLVPRGLRLLPLRRDNTRVILYLFRPAALSRARVSPLSVKAYRAQRPSKFSETRRFL